MIIPIGKYPSPEPKITTAKRQTIADFVYYSICQGQKEIGPIGYSPLPVNLVEAGFGQLNKLKAADSAVDLTERSVETCDNPTFIKGHPSTNYLAKIAPMPPSCDKIGAGPCADGVTPNGTGPKPTSHPNSGTHSGHGTSTTPSGNGPKDGGTAVGGTGTGPQRASDGSSGASGSVPDSSGTHVDPQTGQIVAGNGVADVGAVQDTSGTQAPTIVSANLAGYRAPHLTNVFAPLAAVLLVLVFVLPPMIAVRLSRRRGK
jgi:hypothetical protein